MCVDRGRMVIYRRALPSATDEISASPASFPSFEHHKPRSCYNWKSKLPLTPTRRCPTCGCELTSLRGWERKGGARCCSSAAGRSLLPVSLAAATAAQHLPRCTVTSNSHLHMKTWGSSTWQCST